MATAPVRTRPMYLFALRVFRRLPAPLRRRVVRAGTPLTEVNAALAAEGQHLSFEPPACPGSTIGGVLPSSTMS
mgnify:CR=1 FL=1